MALNLFQRWWNLREAARSVFLRGEWRQENGEPTPNAGRILADLKQFCRHAETCAVFGPNGYDTHATAVAEGRREVLLRIQHLLNLDDETLLKMRNPDDEE